MKCMGIVSEDDVRRVLRGVGGRLAGKAVNGAFADFLRGPDQGPATRLSAPDCPATRVYEALIVSGSGG